MATPKSNRWGKVHSGPPWWGPEGILPFFTLAEMKIWAFLTAKCGSLNMPTTISVREIREATQLGKDATVRAIKVLIALGLFLVAKKRDDHGHWYRTWKRADPPWNEVEVTSFIRSRKVKAEEKAESAQRVNLEYDSLQQGPCPDEPDKALSGRSRIPCPDGRANRVRTDRTIKKKLKK